MNLMRRLSAFIALLLLAPCAARVAQAQDETEIDPALQSRLQLADSYARAAQYDRAIPLLEDLYHATPGVRSIQQKLQKAYEAVKRYDDVIALLDRTLEHAPSPEMRAEKARLVYLKGDEQAAFALWEAVLAGAPKEEYTYRILYNSLIQVRLLHRAVDVLTHGRAHVGNPQLFQIELAYLYTLIGNHSEAMEEYLALLKHGGNQLNYVRNQLSRSLEQEGALNASIATVERHIAEAPDHRSAHDLLAWLYMEAGRYREALRETRIIDRMDPDRGTVLFNFARRAAEASAYDIAMEAFDELLTREPDSPLAAEAQLGLADMHLLWAETTQERSYDASGNRLAAPHQEAALNAFREFLQRFPHHERYAEILHRMGRLQQDVFHNLGEAAAIYSEVIRTHAETEAAARARFDLGRIAIARGGLEEARSIFAGLVQSIRFGAIAEEARYQQALIHFYRGELDIAAAHLSDLDENTATDTANDAIALRIVILENRGPDSLHTPLRMFARASLLLRQHRSRQALATMDTLVSRYGAHPIADDARFLRAQALRTAGSTQEALVAFAELPLVHPDSPFCDESLFQVAEILHVDLGDHARAVEAYTNVLVQYPGSPLASATRLRIRILRGDGV